MRRLGLVVAVTTVFSVGCTKDQPVQPPTTGGPAFLISDGTHSGGNANFFFLPPLVPDPSGSSNLDVGTFNSKLSPTVEICQLHDDPRQFPTTACVDGAPVFGPMPMPLDGEQYHLNWDTKASPLQDNLFYRLIVRGTRQSKPLGFLDLDPVSGGMKNLKTGEVVMFQDGRTLPIKVRIEEGAFGSTNPDHVEQVVPSHITTPTGTLDVTTTTGFAGARFSDGWLPSGIDQVVVIIERVPVSDGSQATSCLRSGLNELEGCYRFRTDPDLHGLGPDNTDLTFRVNVIAGVCFEMSIHTDAPFQLHRREEDSEGTPTGETVALTDVEAPFLTCDRFAATGPVLTLRDLRSGRVREFARAGWHTLVRGIGRLVTPQALHAVDLGAGGSTDGFSRFGYARAGTMTKTAGDNQIASSGTRAPVDPTVCLTTSHPTPANLVGEPVTFTVTAGGGALDSAVVHTHADGCAHDGWVLGSSTTPGGQSLSASAAVSNSPATFTATGTPVVAVFTGRPTTTTAGQGVPVQVTVENANGDTIKNFLGSVTVTIGSNPSGGTLSGTTTVSLVSGTATFGDLGIAQVGNGYTLVATATSANGVTPTLATSAPFDINAQPVHIGVNSFVIDLRAGMIANASVVNGGGFYKGTQVMFASGFAYGTRGSDVLVGYNTSTGASRFDLSTPPTVVGADPLHTTVPLTPRFAGTGIPGVGVTQESFAFSSAPDADYVLLKYTLTNPGGAAVNGVFAGFVADMDLLYSGSAGDDNASFNADLGVTVAAEANLASFPQVTGIVPITSADAALDYIGYINVGSRPRIGPTDPPTLAGYFGFLSSGIVNPLPLGPSDIRQVIGFGPFSISAGGSQVVWFALVGGDNSSAFGANVTAARAKAAALSSSLLQFACSLEPTLHSITGLVSTSIQFVNQTTGPVTVYWLDYQGQRVFYNTLAAGQSYDQQTFLTHPWVVTDASGACLGIWLPSTAPGTALIGG